MKAVTEKTILEALRNVKDPDLNKDLVTLGFIKDVEIKGGAVSFKIELTTPACPVREHLKSESVRYVQQIPGVETVAVTMTSQVRKSKGVQAQDFIPQVKNVVPVASGKGGVGKSTVSVNLALALAAMGAKVGLLDADVYGPSIPTLMGVTDPIVVKGDRIIPAVQYGIKVISTAPMIPPGRAAIMRGPMLHKIIEQFLGKTEWGELDYLVIDLPPGTGDVHLSLCQMIPLTGAAIVSTPQDVALRVAEKAIFMFRQLRTPVLGLIENMSYFTCDHGVRHEIFGHGGGKRYCVEKGIPFLGEIPLATEIRELSDAGKPIVYTAPDSEHAKAFTRVAGTLAAQMSIQAMGAATGAVDGNTPERMDQSRKEIVFLWKDDHLSHFSPYYLRCQCPCAICVDEKTGEKIMREDTIDKDVWARSISPVGRYGIQIEWSDGHSTGIYTFEKLREHCLCKECEQKRDAVRYVRKSTVER